MLQGENLVVTIIAISLVTFLTRAFPFILFSKKGKRPPDIIMYLGKFLPPAIISCILVHCFRLTEFTKFPFGLREILSAGAVSIIYYFKENAMLGILTGTGIYMIFTNFLM